MSGVPTKKPKQNTLKVVVIGDPGVGKTCLMQRYMNGTFSSEYRTTVGADFLSTKITVNETTYNLQVWDTAGQEKFQSIGSAFYRGSDCCVIVYDITNPGSFEKMNTWKHEFLEQGDIKNPEKFPFIIIGNKADREAERKVEKSKALHWVEQQGKFVHYFETSAKNNTQVSQCFEKVTEVAAEQVKEQDLYIPNTTVNINQIRKTKPKTKEGCSC